MSRTREVRELQFSSTQLIVLFLAILVLGVFIFLLGVSVGKKQVRLSQEAALTRRPASETVKRIMPSVAPEGEPSDIEKEISSHAQNSSGPAGTAASQARPGSGRPADKVGSKPSAIPAKVQPAPTARKSVSSAKPASKTPSKAVAPAPIKGQYYIQLAAFDDKKSADSFAAEIKAGGFPALVLSPLPTDKKPWYRVRVGGYATKEDAEKAVLRLKAVVNTKKFEYWITRD
jgi:cell division protein FtsN